MVSDQLFEFFVLLDSFGFDVVEVLLESFNFSLLGFDESLHDGSSGIEITFKFGFKSDSFLVGVGKVLVESRDVGIANLLER